VEAMSGVDSLYRMEHQTENWLEDLDRWETWKSLFRSQIDSRVRARTCLADPIE